MQKSNTEMANLKVDAFTTPIPLVVDGDMSISRVISEMESHEIRHLPVINNEGIAIGVITDRDVATVKSFAFNRDIKASDLMSAHLYSVNEGSSLLEAVYLMSDKKIGSLIVNDETGKVVGIFTSTDALNALIEILRGDILETEL